MNQQPAQTSQQTPSTYQQPSTPQPINDLTLIDVYSVPQPKA